MTDTLCLTGLVATEPRHLVTSEGLTITSFRLASTPRRFDRGAQKWIDGETNWFTVTAFRQLAVNVSESVHKSQRLVVTGRLRVRDWESGDRTGTTVEITADSIGHDLAWGTATWTRTLASSPAKEEDSFAEIEAEQNGFPPAVASDDGSPAVLADAVATPF